MFQVAETNSLTSACGVLRKDILAVVTFPRNGLITIWNLILKETGPGRWVGRRHSQLALSPPSTLRSGRTCDIPTDHNTVHRPHEKVTTPQSQHRYHLHGFHLCQWRRNDGLENTARTGLARDRRILEFC